MRIHQNYYKFSFGNYCGLLIDEKTMRKITKLQAETMHKIKDILANADTKSYNWTIADEPESVRQDDRTLYYCDDGQENRLDLVREIFGIKKVKDLYFVSGRYNESRRKAEEEHQKYLEETRVLKSNITTREPTEHEIEIGRYKEGDEVKCVDGHDITRIDEVTGMNETQDVVVINIKDNVAEYVRR